MYFLLLLQKKVPKKSSPGNLFAKRFPETLPKGRGIFAEDAKMRGPIKYSLKTRLLVLAHYGGSSMDFTYPALPALGYFARTNGFLYRTDQWVSLLT